MTSFKVMLAASLLTAASVVIGVSTGTYIGYRKASEKLNLSSDAIGQGVATLAGFEGALHNIIGDDDGEFGKRAAALHHNAPFTAPADRRMTEAQFLAFLSVKEQLASVDEAMVADMKRDQETTGREVSAGSLMKWNFFSRVQRLRMAQIAELERQHMSVEEYNWVHGAIYEAMVTDGMKAGERGDDWSSGVRDSIGKSLDELDRQLRDPNTSVDRRRELETVRERLAASKESLASGAQAIQKHLAEVPQANRDLVKLHQKELSRVFLAAIDLDTLDVMKGLERAGAH